MLMTYDLRRSPATLFFLIVSILVFGLMQVFYGPLAQSSEAIYQSGGMFGYAVKAMPQELWRLVTPIFIHIGWNHFLINVFTLYFVGQLAESLFGSKQFFVIYLLSGIMGNLFTLIITPNIVAAGASTSLFGLFTAIMHLGAGSNSSALKELAKSYRLLIILNLVFNLFMPNVGLAGHLGGVVGGALLSVFLPHPQTQFRWSKRRRYFSGALYVLMMILGLYYTFH
ncbi:rhomboid family intramembrane serine protease [Streptococcus iniae]|nr:rhomboid family intramembrane serine protease [Streptococcus iniae]